MSPKEYAAALQAFFIQYMNLPYAERMSQYMLNQFEFLGIPSPLRKALAGRFIALNGIPDPAHLEEVVKLVWQMPQRELHYVIMEIASRKLYMIDEGRIYLFEFMVTHQSWWDTVDYIASNLIGTWLALHGHKTGKVTELFMQSENMWLQRTVLLFQLKYKGKTDQALLFSRIKELKDSKEFFIRKAIGWSLREFSKTRPQEVLDFLASTEMSPLSRREALKIIQKKATQ